MQSASFIKAVWEKEKGNEEQASFNRISQLKLLPALISVLSVGSWTWFHLPLSIYVINWEYWTWLVSSILSLPVSPVNLISCLFNAQVVMFFPGSLCFYFISFLQCFFYFDYFSLCFISPIPLFFTSCLEFLYFFLPLMLSPSDLFFSPSLSTFSDFESISTSAILAHFCQKLGSSREISVLLPDEMKLA